VFLVGWAKAVLAGAAQNESSIGRRYRQVEGQLMLGGYDVRDCRNRSTDGWHNHFDLYLLVGPWPSLLASEGISGGAGDCQERPLDGMTAGWLKVARSGNMRQREVVGPESEVR
jgi:hypothetical protein